MRRKISDGIFLTAVSEKIKIDFNEGAKQRISTNQESLTYKVVSPCSTCKATVCPTQMAIKATNTVIAFALKR